MIPEDVVPEPLPGRCRGVVALETGAGEVREKAEALFQPFQHGRRHDETDAVANPVDGVVEQHDACVRRGAEGGQAAAEGLADFVFVPEIQFAFGEDVYPFVVEPDGGEADLVAGITEGVVRDGADGAAAKDARLRTDYAADGVVQDPRVVAGGGEEEDDVARPGVP
ncbi:MAG: hypothetical protein LUG50_05420 [Planctomycetaceae bacterium]|nr:hypothetical protein [Planctomycetaceae bacterium]